MFDIFNEPVRANDDKQDEASGSEEFRENENAAEDTFYRLQRSALLAIREISFDESNYVHKVIMDNVRTNLANCIPDNTIQMIKNFQEKFSTISSSESEYSDSLFERDVSEVIGLSQGGNLMKDTQNCGMLGPLCLLHLIERMESIYNDAADKFDGEFSEEKQNFCFINLIEISQNTKDSGKKDGFPLISVFLQVVSNMLPLLDEKAFKPPNRHAKEEM